MRASPILILLVLVAIFVDFGTPNDGAFRFNADESMVGVRSEVRAETPHADRVDATAAHRGPEATVVLPSVPRGRLGPPRRTIAPPARSRLAFVESISSPEDH